MIAKDVNSKLPLKVSENNKVLIKFPKDIN